MPDSYTNFVENKIREAEEQGLFRNLPGQGKPLRFDDDEVGDPKYWLAHHMLKNAGLLPAWVELAKEIDRLEDRVQAIEQEYREWLATEARLLAGLSAAGLRGRLPGIRAMYTRFMQRYQRQLEVTQEHKQRFNYEVPARSLEKSWPPLASRLRDFQRRARHLLNQPELAPLKPAEIEATIDYPITTTDYLREAVGPVNGAGAVLMAGAARDVLRENLLRRISDAASVVMIKRPLRGDEQAEPGS